MVGRRAVCRERGTWLHELSNAGVAEVGGTGAATPAPATWHWGAWLGCTGQCGTFLVASRCWPLPTARVCEKTKVPTSSRHPGQIPTRIATLLHTFRTCTSPAADCNPISPRSYDTRGRHTVLSIALLRGSCVPYLSRIQNHMFRRQTFSKANFTNYKGLLAGLREYSTETSFPPDIYY